MGEIIEFSCYLRARHARTRRRERCYSPVERYSRARLDWELNPTSDTRTARFDALLAVLEAREEPR